MARYKTRMHPDLLQVADELRADYHYHQPDSPHPTRHLLVEMSLRKGLRSLDAHLRRGQPPPIPPESDVLTSDWPRVRVDSGLLEFADRLRGRHYELLCAIADADLPPDELAIGVPYPSRTGLVNIAFLLGLGEVSRLYARPATPSSLRAS